MADAGHCPFSRNSSAITPSPIESAQVDLKPGDMTVKSASGSMLTLDPNMSLQAECEGSWLNGCALCCVGESCWCVSVMLHAYELGHASCE